MGSSSRFSIRSLNRRVGTAANSRTSASSTLKSRSGIGCSWSSASGSQAWNIKPPRSLLRYKEQGRAVRPSISHTPGPPRRPDRGKPRCQLVRRQVRAIRVYRVPLLGVDARGFPGRRLGARTPCPVLTGQVEAGVLLDTAGLVTLAYARRVRGCIRLRVRLPYPYVLHLPLPFLVTLLCPLSAGETLALSSHGFGALPELLEESPYLLPDLPAAAQAPPARSDEPYEAVALGYRNQEVLPRPPHPVYQERFHVPLHRFQRRIAPLQLRPGAQLQERFRRSHRAGIERHYPLGGRAVEEERHVHRDPQALPLHVAHLEVFEEEAAVGYEPVTAFARRFSIEEDGARPADAKDLPRGDFQQVPVLRRYRLAAQLAVLLDGLCRRLCRLLGLLLGEPAERGESGESLPVALLDHVPLSRPRSVERPLLCFAARGPVSPRHLSRLRAVG